MSDSNEQRRAAPLMRWEFAALAVLVVLLIAVLLANRSSDVDGAQKTASTVEPERAQPEATASQALEVSKTPGASEPQRAAATERFSERTPSPDAGAGDGSEPGDASPVPATSESAMNPPESLPTDDDMFDEVTPTGEPATTLVVEGPFVEIGMGELFACGLLESGRVKCWGNRRVTESTPRDALFLSIYASHYAVCGILKGGSLECWGLGDYFDVGDNRGPFTTVALGLGALCALRFEGTIVCSASDAKPEPHEFSSDEFTAVVAGRGIFCSVESRGIASCWAEYSSFSQVLDTEPPDGPFAAIYLDEYGKTACGIRIDGTAGCWGNFRYAEPGQFVELAPGRYHVCGRQLDETITCWGGNSVGQTDAPRGNFLDVSVGAEHSCGVRTVGRLICWGNSRHGATRVPAGQFVAVDSRDFRNCAIRSDGAAVCWGRPF